MRIPAFIFFVVLFCSSLNAQNESYIHYSSKNGLPGNVQYAVCEDPQGYIWIGGASGLSRFDGTHFTNYSVKDGIPDVEILKLHKDKQGRIWMMGFNGKIGYIENGKIVSEKEVPLLKKAKLTNAPLFFYITPQNKIELTDEKGQVVILSFKKGKLKSVRKENRKALFTVDTPSGRLSLYKYRWTLGEKKHKYNYIFNSPIIEFKRSIVVRSQNEITRLDKSGATCLLPLPENHKIRQLSTDDKHQLWFYDEYDCTINCFDPHKKKPVVLTKCHFPFTFNQFKIDSHGNLWVCSQNKGLFLYPKKWHAAKQILVENPITALYYASEGTLVSGNTIGEIRFYNPRNLDLDYTVQRDADMLYTPIRGFKKSCGNMICAYGYLLEKIVDTRFLSLKQIRLINGKDISFDCRGNILIARSGAFYCSKESNSAEGTYLGRNRSYAVCCISGKEYWFSNVFGLHRVKDGIKKTVSGNSDAFSNRISRIERLSDGNLFLLTDGVGCSVLDRKKCKPLGTVFVQPEVNDYRNFLIQKDTIWMATNNGIIILKYGDGVLKLIRKIGQSDGLMSNDILAITCSENNIYASTPEGLSKLDKSTLFDKLEAPELSVNNIYADGISYQGKRVKIPVIPDEIIIDLSALHFGSRAPLEFSYSLNNGKNWNSTNTPHIHLQNPNGGELNVLLKARKIGGEWSAVSKIIITSPTPFFQQFWVRFLLFSITVGIAVWLTILFMGNIRKKQLLAKDTQLTLADLEIKSLRSMMNTHFVFNALNSIQQFIAGKNHLEANRYLGKFSRLMRSHLNASLDSHISLTEELQSLDHYLALEKLRLEDRLSYSIDIPETLPTINIPGFILQPLAENAIWHGIMPLEEGGKVEIKVEITETELIIFIRDNGVGLSPNFSQNQSSRGLQMIRKRFEILTERTGKDHRLRIRNSSEMDPNAPRGVTAIVTITRN